MNESKRITQLDPRGIANDADLIALVAGATGTTKGSSVRDILGSYGMMYLTALSSIIPTAASVFEKLTGTTAPVGLNGFNHSTGRLIYTGTRKRTFEIKGTVSAETNTGLPGEMIDIRIALNGTTVLSTETGSISLLPGDRKTMPFLGLINLRELDEIEVWFSSDQTVLALDFYNMQLLVKAV